MEYLFSEDKIIIKNPQDFSLLSTFDCGQCFRWNINEDDSYTGVVKKNVINIKIVDNDLYIKSYGKTPYSSWCRDLWWYIIV